MPPTVKPAPAAPAKSNVQATKPTPPAAKPAPAPVQETVPETTAAGADNAVDEKEAPTPRVNFVDVAPKNMLDEAGKLIRVPILEKEFNPSEHKRLAKTDFVTEDLFLEHQANLCEVRAQFLAKKAVELRAEAERTRKCGDPEARKKMKRVAKLMEQLKLLQEQLAKDGLGTD